MPSSGSTGWCRLPGPPATAPARRSRPPWRRRPGCDPRGAGPDARLTRQIGASRPRPRPDPWRESELSRAQIDGHADEGGHRLLDVHVVVATPAVHLQPVAGVAAGDPHLGPESLDVDPRAAGFDVDPVGALGAVDGHDVGLAVRPARRTREVDVRPAEVR